MSQYTPGYKTNLNTNRIETLLASLVSSQRKIFFTDEGIPLAAPGDITVVNITGDITATVNGSTLTLSVTSGGGGAEHYRGDYDASSGDYPSGGGSGTAGAIQAGDMWFVSVGDSGFKFPPSSILIARINSPGQTDSDWRII